MARLRYLDQQDVEAIVHKLAANLFGGEYKDPLPAFQLFGGLRQGGALLDSALALPRQPYYRKLHDKAGALLRSLVKNHPLVDGNKRIGLTTTFVFLLINGHLLVASNQEMIRFAVEVAASEPDMSWQDVGHWLRQHTIPLTGDQREAIRLVKKRFDDPSEIVERLTARWSEIERFIAS